MNSAYKHLDAKLKIGDLTLGQWCGVGIGAAVAFAWGFYLSPFGGYLTIGSAVYLGAVPVGLALMSTTFEINVGVVLFAAVTWLRLDGAFAPGPGEAQGYLVRRDPLDDEDPKLVLASLDPATLWES